MLSPEESRRALQSLFGKKRIVTLEVLLKVLRTRSRMSVFRRLSMLGYITSYSHAGMAMDSSRRNWRPSVIRASELLLLGSKNLESGSARVQRRHCGNQFRASVGNDR